MESLDTEACFVDELLNFSSDIGEDEDQKPHKTLLDSLKPAGLLGPAGSPRPSQEIAEEELEWISNKDAFPAVESFVGVGILSEGPSGVAKLHSPISVLEGSSISSNSNSNSSSNVSNAANNNSTLMSCCGGLKAPRRARSKRRSRHRRAGFADITSRQLWGRGSQFIRNRNVTSHTRAEKVMTTSTMGRKCQHCGAEKTPQWRAGPYGPKTLCNACGVRFKSGRLVPEYRPASSPTFSNELHSNSHRKIIEMRRTKQMTGMIVKHPLESG